MKYFIGFQVDFTNGETGLKNMQENIVYWYNSVISSTTP